MADELVLRGHRVEIPLTSQRIISGEVDLRSFILEKDKNGDASFRESAALKIKDDVIGVYYKKIKAADAVLVVNPDKNGIANYIGGNTFLEMGFAHVLHKKIYLYNPIPEMSYSDEIRAMRPMVINGDLGRFV